MDEKTKALANDIIGQCQKQGLSFKQMDILLLNLSTQLQSAKKELIKSTVEEAKVKLKPFYLLSGREAKETEKETQKKTAVPVEEVQEQQFIEKISLDSLENQKREHLSLAKKFHVSLSFAIEHYDTLSKLDT